MATTPGTRLFSTAARRTSAMPSVAAFGGASAAAAPAAMQNATPRPPSLLFMGSSALGRPDAASLTEATRRMTDGRGRLQASRPRQIPLLLPGVGDAHP